MVLEVDREVASCRGTTRARRAYASTRARPRSPRAPRPSSVRAARQRAGERAVERVAGAGRVDHVDLAGRGAARPTPPSASSAPSAPTVTTTGAPVRSASARAAASGSSSPLSAHASSAFGRQQGGEVEQLVRQRPRRRRVEHDGQARVARRAPASTAASGTSSAEQHDAARRARQRALDRLGRQLVRSRPRRPRSGSRPPRRPRSAPRRSASSSRCTAETSMPSASSCAIASSPSSSSPTAAIIRTAAPGARRRDGLVGALAAAVALERPARHRLARPRQRRAAATTRSTLTEPTT